MTPNWTALNWTAELDSTDLAAAVTTEEIQTALRQMR
jgi:hypothetical protein